MNDQAFGIVPDPYIDRGIENSSYEKEATGTGRLAETGGNFIG